MLDTSIHLLPTAFFLDSPADHCLFRWALALQGAKFAKTGKTGGARTHAHAVFLVLIGDPKPTTPSKKILMHISAQSSTDYEENKIALEISTITN